MRKHNVTHYVLWVCCVSLHFTASHAWISPKTGSPMKLLTTLRAVNNNIVLQPSETETKFDNWKIGNARVHRYARDSDSETEYVMWFHGRSKEMDTPNLPPLSTGRIGRATSKNGLVWVKDDSGSESEDIPDICLGLNKESWWGFDTSHVGRNVLLPMSTPAVLSDSGVYLMYFMGGSFEETPIAEYMVDPPESVVGANIQGMKMRIGVAISQDGISWGRVEGDDPTGAIMAPYDKNDPNGMFNDVPTDMHEELYCAWPEVTVDMDAPEDERFLMYYSTMTKDSKEKCIARGVSPDGFRWYKKGICLRPDNGEGLDAGGIARCCVFRDAEYDEYTNAWTEKYSWTMYYEGVSPNDNKHRVMVATSRDSKTWTKQGVALDVGADSDAWDFGGVGAPHVLRMDDGSSRMYYTGQSSDGRTAIGVAKLSPGSAPTQWIREQATITFAL